MPCPQMEVVEMQAEGRSHLDINVDSEARGESADTPAPALDSKNALGQPHAPFVIPFAFHCHSAATCKSLTQAAGSASVGRHPAPAARSRE